MHLYVYLLNIQKDKQFLCHVRNFLANTYSAVKMFIPSEFIFIILSFCQAEVPIIIEKNIYIQNNP